MDNLKYLGADYSEMFLVNIQGAFRSKRNYIVDRLIDAFKANVHFTGNDSFVDRIIENIVEEFYFPALEHEFKKIREFLEENICLQTKILEKQVEGIPDEKDKYLLNFRNEILRIYNDIINRSLEDLNAEFLQEFKSKLIRRFEPLGERVEDAIRYDVAHEAKHQLERFTGNLFENADLMLDANNLIQKANEIVEEYVNNKEEVKEELPDVSKEIITSIAKLFGYTLELDGSIGKLIDSFGKPYTVKVTPKGVTSSSTNSKAEIQYDINGIIFFDPTRQQKVSVSMNNEIKVESLNFDRTYEVQINNGQVEFIWNGKKVEEGQQKKVIINQISKMYPLLYEEVSNTNAMGDAFKEALDQADKEEFYTDGLKLNEEQFAEFKKRMQIAGYDIDPKEDGIYVTNTTTLEKDKLVETKYGLSLENNPNIRICPDVTIISKNIATKCMQIIKNNGDLLISSGFNYFGYSDKDRNYKLIIEDDGPHYYGEGASEEEIKAFFEKEFPNIMTYANSNTKWEEYGKEEPKNEEVQEEKTGEELLDEKLEKLAQTPEVKAYLELLRLKESLNKQKGDASLEDAPLGR